MQAHEKEQVIHYPTEPIARLLGDFPFPATKAQLLARAGNQTLRLADGSRVLFRSLLEKSRVDLYPSLADVSEAVGRVLITQEQLSEAEQMALGLEHPGTD